MPEYKTDMGFQGSKSACRERCEFICAAGYNSLHAGDFQTALTFFQQAVELDADYVHSYMGLAKASLPGDGYIEIIRKLIALRKPERYVEIGVEKGSVLKLFDASVRIVGVDPAPQVDKLSGNVKLYEEPSDDFFAGNDLEVLLGGCFDLAFIDGLHIFEQVLRDFINLERYAAPDSICLIHDCLPLDERTSERQRSTIFWSGDVWKIIPCLKNVRPELSIFTIPAYPAGLCVVTGLNRKSQLLAESYESIVKKYSILDYGDIKEPSSYFTLISNDWTTIEQSLQKNLAKVADK